MIIWEIETGNQITTLQVDCPSVGVSSIDWSPSGRYVASSDCFTIRIWDVGTWNEIRIFRDPSGVASARWSPDEKYVAFSSGDPAVWEDTRNLETTASHIFGQRIDFDDSLIKDNFPICCGD